MHPPISEADLAVLLDEADAAAARLWRRLGLPRADLEDLRQDLLLDLIRRLPAFDARRGSIGAFAGMVLRHQAVRIAVRVARERRAANGALLSLDATGADGRSLGEGLSDEDGLAAWHGQDTAPQSGVERRIDLSRSLGALDGEDRALCAALGHCPLGILVERGFGSRHRRAPLRADRARPPGGLRRFPEPVSRGERRRPCR